jgi:hypothetical protein
MTRDDFVRAVRDLHVRLGHVPSPAEVRAHLGIKFDRAVEMHFRSPVEAIARSLRENPGTADTPPPSIPSPRPIRAAPTPSPTPQCIVARPAPKTLATRLLEFKARGIEITDPLSLMLVSGILELPLESAIAPGSPLYRLRPTWATLTQSVRTEGPGFVQKIIHLARLTGSIGDEPVQFVSLAFDYENSEFHQINDFQVRIEFWDHDPQMEGADAVVFEIHSDHYSVLHKFRGEYSEGVQYNWENYWKAHPQLLPKIPDEEPEFGVAIEAALTGWVRQNCNYVRAFHVEPTRDDLRNYVLWHKGQWVEALFAAQATEKDGMSSLPDRVLVAALMSSSRRTDQVHGLRLLDVSQESQLGESHARWEYVYSHKQRQRVLSRAEGPWAWEIGLAWLEAQGEVPRDALEKDYLASVWGTRIRRAGTQSNGTLAEVVLWDDVVARIRSEGSQFLGRLIMLPHRDVDQSDKLFAATKKNYNGQDRAYGVTILDGSKIASSGKEAAKLDLRWSVNGNEWVVNKARGENSDDLAYPWIESRGIDVKPVIVRALIAGMLGMRTRLAAGEETLKNDLKLELLKPGGLQHLLDVRHQMDPDFDPHARHVNVVLGFRGDHYYGLQVLTDAEVETAAVPKTSARFRFENQKNGGRQLVAAEGLGQQSLGGVGQVFAPDADAIDETDSIVRALTSLPSGYSDAAPVMRPEPLITPAEVMTLPQMEYPADAVDLPKMGGYEILDPDELTALQIPPSILIPSPSERGFPQTGQVGEGIDEESGVVATIAAMIIGAILVRVGGPALLRVPTLKPSFGSGSMMVSPCDHDGFDGT